MFIDFCLKTALFYVRKKIVFNCLNLFRIVFIIQNGDALEESNNLLTPLAFLVFSFIVLS